MRGTVFERDLVSSASVADPAKVTGRVLGVAYLTLIAGMVDASRVGGVLILERLDSDRCGDLAVEYVV